jgi:Alpha/beta hydrolase domain
VPLLPCRYMSALITARVSRPKKPLGHTDRLVFLRARPDTRRDCIFAGFEAVLRSIPAHVGLIASKTRQTCVDFMALRSSTQLSAITPSVVPERDVFGNILGGIRLPDFAVPIATDTGINFNPVPPIPGVLCNLYGQYIPFDKQMLRAFYPTAGTYLSDTVAASHHVVVSRILCSISKYPASWNL